MRDDAYRSYVIRVRRRAPRDAASAGRPGPTRLDIEDLLGGSTATVSGEAATVFADSLERLVETGRQAPPPARRRPDPEATS